MSITCSPEQSMLLPVVTSSPAPLASPGSRPPVRFDVPLPAAVPTGTAEPPWPTPAECFLDQLAPPDHDWSAGSFETGTVELDTAAIVAAVAVRAS
jgi:hypothetical protein